MRAITLAASTAILFGSLTGRAPADDAKTAKKNKHALATRALADYVAKKDTSYGWNIRRQGKVSGADYAELILTSQTWRKVTWRHQLFVILPPNADKKSKHALMFITGGRWKDELRGKPNGEESLPREAGLFASLASQLGTPIAVLLQVPHQPIFDNKYEDAAIAHTFEQFLKTGDPEWPLLLPMVKSVSRGMDAVQDFAFEHWSRELATFTVTGASKRGWTTWLAGAVEKRATAIAPMVIDMLNMTPQLQHQKKAWGELSYKISDYTERGLHEQLQTEKGNSLQRIVDPYRYRNQLLQPKLIMIGTNDHYWPLDALNFYWRDLRGPKHILYVPNNRHGLKDLTRVIGSLSALHQFRVSGKPLPQLKWSFGNGEGGLRLRATSDRPTSMRAWVARSDTRDFRQSQWKSEPMSKSEGAFSFDLATPKKGFAAVFGEAVYNDYSMPAFFSTNLRITGAAAE